MRHGTACDAPDAGDGQGNCNAVRVKAVQERVETAFIGSSDTASVTLVSVTSNEPDAGVGDGDTAQDIVIVDHTTVKLRAERSRHGAGRVYTLTYQATNGCGNTATATATVTVRRK